ncbi:MAG: hypothetical protein ABI867_39010 [Kofleriaceae bacterium]
MRFSNVVVSVSLLVASTSFALPPGAAKRGLREGANHHTGDQSFVERFGRAPRPGDDEKVRMRVHFQHVRAWLASRPATRPDLKVKREQLLAFLDEYIAKGLTPKNVDLKWRTPVFIDHENTICAVGYLIERSAGRALPEKIAATHRFSYIEDIARVMPEVQAWVDASGLTLEEIASIQPGYEGPEIDQYQRWTLAQMKTGEFRGSESGFDLTGRFRRHQMTGEWTKSEGEGDAKLVRGTGTFAMGSGTWRSNYKTGARMAEGKFAGSTPTGTWRFYHPSGNLAAEGRLEGTTRRGEWKFYYDTHTPVVFAKGKPGTSNGWKYFDEAGQLVVTMKSATPWRRGWGMLATVQPGADQVRYSRYSATLPLTDDPTGMGETTSFVLESYQLGKDHLYTRTHRDDAEQEAVSVQYDGDGNRLAHVDGGWQASNCTWSRQRKQAARTGDIVRLQKLLVDSEKEVCGPAVAVPEARAHQLDIAFATRKVARAPIPAFVQAIANYENAAPDLGAETDSEPVADDPAAELTDLVSFASGDATNHIDTRFIQVFRTIPGTRHRFDEQ